MQRFDVGISSSLKTHLERFTREAVQLFKTEFEALADQTADSATAEARRTLVRSFLNARHAGAIPRNVERAFEATSLVPINLDRPKRMQFLGAGMTFLSRYQVSEATLHSL
jgi:hypothetical protein